VIASDCSLQLMDDRHKVYELPVTALAREHKVIGSSD